MPKSVYILVLIYSYVYHVVRLGYRWKLLCALSFFMLLLAYI